MKLPIVSDFSPHQNLLSGMAFFIVIPGDLGPDHTGKHTNLRVCSSRKGTDRLLRKVVQKFHPRSVGPERGQASDVPEKVQAAAAGRSMGVLSEGLGALVDIIQFHVTIFIFSYRKKFSNPVTLGNVSRTLCLFLSGMGKYFQV